MRKHLLAVVLIVAGAPPVLAQEADDYGARPHFYLGADVGQSTLRNDSLGFDQHGYGFDLRAGVRPIRYLGAEIEYVDLGDRHDFSDACFGGFHCDGTHVRAQGGAAFGVVYLPIPHSLVELYGKAGAARLQTRATSTQFCDFCDIVILDHTDTTDTDFAWGGGLQLHWWNFGFRGEFQQFQTHSGHPSLVSAGFTWELW
ncbi:MAG TPA: outer membrane beta-barrel protein [Steroidobacteraceae bacterium]|nr:outer membrane beta-barrel protein [Steroidobacteraceae bacterium]